MTGNNINKFFIFVAGAAVGSAVTWKLFKAKYEQIANEEIEEMREYYNRREKEREEAAADKKEVVVKEKVSEPEVNKDVVDYSKLATRYSSESETKPDLKKLVESDSSDPYIIPPEEFGEIEDYSQVELTYYADGYLADDCDELVDHVEDVIGWELLERIGEYEPDALHVRNDRTKTDYEILRDLRNFKDVISE